MADERQDPARNGKTDGGLVDGVPSMESSNKKAKANKWKRIMGLFDIGNKFKPRPVCGMTQSRFIEPHDCEDLDEVRIKYANAENLANDIGDIPMGYRAFVFLDGKFIFGDLLEAIIVNNNWQCEELTISTLSMSRENVDSLANLINGGFLKQLNLIVSHYYFATERRELMPYIYEKLDINDVLQLAVASVHTKIAMIRTTCGKKITIHGSANLRTSSNIEQIVIEHSPDLFDFSATVHHSIIEMHKTINKPIRSTLLWQQVLAEDQPNTSQTGSNPKATKRPQPRQSEAQASTPQQEESEPSEAKPHRSKSTHKERF